MLRVSSLLIFVLPTIALAQDAPAEPSWEILLRNVNLIAGVHSKPRVTDIAVSEEGGRIDRIANNLVGKATHTVEAQKDTALYVKPGLIDMHAHISYKRRDASRSSTDLSPNDPIRIREFKLFIANGVTGIRLMDTKYLEMRPPGNPKYDINLIQPFVYYSNFQW